MQFQLELLSNTSHILIIRAINLFMLDCQPAQLFWNLLLSNTKWERVFDTWLLYSVLVMSDAVNSHDFKLKLNW
jgi:hypothetical protein